MNEHRLEFEQSVDGLFRGALQADKDAGLCALLKRSGLDLEKLQPAYPAADFYRWVQIAAKHRFPELDGDEACAEVGRLAVQRGLNSTFIGRALLQTMKLLGVRRSLLRIGRSFKNGNNYIEANVVERGERSLEISLEPVVGPAGYFHGVIEEGTRVLGAKDVEVVRNEGPGERITFLLEWTE